jgi:gliding motility-associated-like protein
MKHLNPVCLNTFFKRIALLSLLFTGFNFAYGQCPIPFPKGDIDSTFRNVPVATVVTHNDITAFGSGIPVSGDSLSIYQQPTHGSVTVLNDSTVVYTPNPGFVGNDFYVYTICNACGNCSQASVTIEVKPYCPPPVARADHYQVYNNVPSVLNVTANDQNIAAGPLTLTVIHNPRHGTAVVSGSNVDFTCTQAGYTGTDTFVYLIRDTCTGRNTDSAFVYLTVVTCHKPSALNDTFSVQQQSSVSGDLATNDQYANGFGNVTISFLNAPKFGSTLSISGSIVTYTGGPVGFGLDTIRYQICTDCGCDTALAIFRVTKRPCSAPVAHPDIAYAGYSITCTSVFNILLNDTLPINGGTPAVTLLGPAAFGTATIVNGTLHYTCTDSARAGQSETLRYSVCNSCFCDTNSVIVNITNYPCNGLNPDIRADSARVCRNYSVVLNVTANDVSQQGFPVTVNAITGQGAHGTAAIVNGSSIRYTPDATFCGVDYFVYQACDNGSPSLCNLATVTVHVDCCNDAPVILNTAGNPTDTIHVSVYEDSSTGYCFHYTYLDSPQVYIAHIGPSLDTVNAVSLSPGTNPCITIRPPTHGRTEQTVEVVICSETPACDTVVVIISIIPINHAPVALPDSIGYNWSASSNCVNALVNDSDRDPGDHLTITAFDAVTANGGHISQSGDSTFCYTADSFWTGIDTFRYTVCDTSHNCVTTFVVVTVPIQARNDEGMTQQDSTVVINLTANDTRATNETITLCSQPLHGTVTIDSLGAHYTPEHDYPVDPISKDTLTYVGADSFCYTLCHTLGTTTTCANAEVYIVIMPKAKFGIPQGISPNGDGINDKFVIASVDQYPLSQLLVYNRYGDEVWRNDGDGYQNDFDGTWKKNGQPLPDGSYWYIFKFNDGVTHDRMGYIVIQR